MNNNFFNDTIKKEEVIIPQTDTKSNPFIEVESVDVKTKHDVVEEKLNGVKYNQTNIMELNHINQTYDDGKIVIFDDFNLQIKDIADRGQFIAIIGESGCGKCFSKNSFITIRNKKTQKIEKIKADDFIKRLRKPN